ncbi:hypothetical protein [Gottfriedia acidiceleris]|uniref:hypothetical protein n=1 Tax=Gottfriedia acidiceleris TaxID=371036 RepID=UPI000B44A0C7|nr:hypothetical protein [Gottfriedia acidiceleris]
MTNFIKEISLEYYYQYKAKYFIILVLALLLLSAFVVNSQFLLTKSTLQNYKHIEEVYRRDNIDIKDALNDKLNLKRPDSNTEVVDNYLKYEHLNYQYSLKALKPINSINQLFSSISLIILPIIFSMYSICVAHCDIKYKTLKVLLINKSIVKYHINKMVSILGVIILSTLGISIVHSINQWIVFRFFMRIDPSVPNIDDSIFSFSFADKIPTQIIFILIINIFFSILFYFASVLTRSKILPSSILFIYMFLVPNMGKFDIKNIILYSVPKIFDTKATLFSTHSGNEFPMYYIFIWVTILIFFSLFVVYISDKRSKYY